MPRETVAYSALARAERLTLVRHGHEVVRDISFHVPFGVIGALWADVGTTSTLFEALVGERTPARGALSVGHALRVSEQSGPWAPAMSALEYAQLVALTMDPHRRTCSARSIRDEMRLVGLPYWQTLGTMGRWAPLLCRIAAALATNPALLLLETPELLESRYAERIIARLLSHVSQRHMSALLAVGALSQVPAATRWIAHSNAHGKWVSGEIGEGGGQFGAFDVSRPPAASDASSPGFVARSQRGQEVERWLVNDTNTFRAWCNSAGIAIGRGYSPDAIEVFSMLNA